MRKTGFISAADYTQESKEELDRLHEELSDAETVLVGKESELAELEATHRMRVNDLKQERLGLEVEMRKKQQLEIEALHQVIYII